MTVRTNDSKVRFVIVVGISVDMVDFQWHTLGGRMSFIPTAQRTFLTAHFDKVPF